VSNKSAVVLISLVLLGLFIPFLTSCSPGIPSSLEGRWIQYLDAYDAQVFVFSSGSVEHDFVSYGSITSTWIEKFTKVFTTANGVDIIETSGPPTFAWHVAGDSLYLDWVNSDQETQLENLASNWWQADSLSPWTKY
jgi:hypothetical protein